MMPVFEAEQNNLNFNIKTMLRAPGKIFRPDPNKTLAASENRPQSDTRIRQFYLINLREKSNKIIY
jgi:hypothetical protein